MADEITRNEVYLSAIAEGSSDVPDPITREEQYLAKIAGADVGIPEKAITRKEQYYKKIVDNGGGGGSATLIEKSISANGVYNASDDSADGYSKATVDVPNSYAAGDEGKVVSNGALVSQTSATYDSNGTYDTTLKNSVTVNVQPPVEPALKDINFFDYDGTLLYSYTKQEWANVTDMPTQPSHDGLIASGWSITKNAIDTAISYYYEPIIVGALYITQSGKTEVDITVSGTYMSPTLRICPKGTATINWGDGSAEETLTGTSLTTGKSLNHTYSSNGNYTITIDATSGELALGASSGSTTVAPLISSSGGGASQDNLPRAYSNMIRAVRMGRNTCLSGYAFANCGSMESITIPPKQETQSVYICNGVYIFSQCASLRFASLTGVWQGVYLGTSIRYACDTNANDNTFQNCNSLIYANLRNTGTAVGSASFQGCRSLTAITIPSSVTEIKSNAFNNCRSLRYIYMKSTSVPTLSSNALSTGSSLLSKIYVPYSEDHSILDAYKGASNWSSYADKIEEMPQ